jgi:hypothetical protein
MSWTPSTFRRIFWILVACALLLPRLAAAGNPVLVFDLDGDGRTDHAKLTQPSVIEIWLSGSGTTQIIRSGVPLMMVVATDLDGDHRPELIGLDGKSEVVVWKRKHRRFHTYQPRKVAPATPQHHRSLDDNDPGPPDAIGGTLYLPATLTPCAMPRAPAVTTSIVRPVRRSSSYRSVTSFVLVAPRPPPASALL